MLRFLASLHLLLRLMNTARLQTLRPPESVGMCRFISLAHFCHSLIVPLPTGDDSVTT
jgi:hypothetical protein